MPNLSDKLKSLGVKVGAKEIPRPETPSRPHGIEQVLQGRLHSTQSGDAFLVETLYEHDYRHGHINLHGMAPLETLADWAGDDRIKGCPVQQFAYVDIETTGLAGGTGTYAFLIGAGRFVEGGFQLTQFFMRDPIEEPAQLLAFEEFMAPCDTLVTYNGKSFDAPIINTRFISQGWQPLLVNYAHIDLLHLARRLWKDRLPSRTLGNIETLILGMRRSEEDVPGWLVPQLYFDYLKDGDARPLKSVFYHNAMDVVAMAALLNYVSHLIEDAIQPEVQVSADLLGMGKLYEDLGRMAEAIGCYRRALEQGLPHELFLQLVERLSFIMKRSGDYPAAVALWEQAAGHQQVYACVELAKYYEHQARDCETAARWARQAQEIIYTPGFPFVQRKAWQDDLDHRIERLVNKLKKA